MNPSANAKPYDPRTDFANPPDVVVVDTHRVSCQGVGGALGHPLVYYELGADGFVDCQYCDRRFVMRGTKHDPAVGG